MRIARCAIYTRKSTEEGLDQEFNSLDAQREACEAYVKSQAGEGWRALPARYDDGGFSGGNMDRPAIQRLLADVDEGKVDVIVVYKVDRLTRSLMDFAKIVERLDAQGVSFVSVTQAFNTTTSMGRLTLNVLLSFAQFEREVTSERIRDKIAASKAKGMWMGGNIPLGYDLQDRKLVINVAEAEQVRHLFRRYLALGSGVQLIEELRANEIVSKKWVTRGGRQMGGAYFRCGSLYHLLQSRLYLGEVVHRGTHHEGQHEAIVSEELFNAVQELLASNRQKRREKPTRAAKCPLSGLVFDAEGVIMAPSFSYGRKGKLYRYYVSASLLPGNEVKWGGGDALRRIPAAGLEKLVLERLTELMQPAEKLSWAAATQILSRVEIYQHSIQLVLGIDTLLEPHEPPSNLISRLQQRVGDVRLILEEGGSIRLICDRRPRFRGGEKFGGRQLVTSGSTLVTAAMLRSAHELLEAHSMSPLNAGEHSAAIAPKWQRDRRLMAVGLLSPLIQKKILQGADVDIDAVMRLQQELPLAWRDQEAMLLGRSARA